MDTRIDHPILTLCLGRPTPKPGDGKREPSRSPLFPHQQYSEIFPVRRKGLRDTILRLFCGLLVGCLLLLWEVNPEEHAPVFFERPSRYYSRGTHDSVGFYLVSAGALLFFSRIPRFII